MGDHPLKETTRPTTPSAITVLMHLLGIDRQAAANMFDVTLDEAITYERETAGVSFEALSYMMALFGTLLSEEEFKQAFLSEEQV